MSTMREIATTAYAAVVASEETARLAKEDLNRRTLELQQQIADRRWAMVRILLEHPSFSLATWFPDEEWRVWEVDTTFTQVQDTRWVIVYAESEDNIKSSDRIYFKCLIDHDTPDHTPIISGIWTTVYNIDRDTSMGYWSGPDYAPTSGSGSYAHALTGPADVGRVIAEREQRAAAKATTNA